MTPLASERARHRGAARSSVMTAGVLCLALLVLRCTPEPDPGQLGGVCVEGDLCDFGLACRSGRCQAEIASGGAPGVDAGEGGGGSGGDGTGGTDVSSGGSASGTGGNGNGGRGNAMGGSSGSGNPGSMGGSSSVDGGVGGSGSSCVGLPSVRGRCNRNACLCPETNECFPAASAAECCEVAPECN